jgi:DNA polymerase
VSDDSPARRRERLVALYRRLSDGHVCPLVAGRTRLVFGAGYANAELMFVGEAPGAEEDRQGKPFVGRAGKLLDTLLEEAGLRREDTFVANVLKCRPPGNRDPLPEEIEECSPWLFRQIELIEPLVVCTLGNFATKLLTGSTAGITKVHGRPQRHELGGRSVQLFPLFHPAAALRTEAVRELLRADLATLPGLLERTRGEARNAAPSTATAPELGPGLPKPGPPPAERGAEEPSRSRAAAGPSSPPPDAESPPADPPQLDLFERPR